MRKGSVIFAGVFILPFAMIGISFSEEAKSAIQAAKPTQASSITSQAAVPAQVKAQTTPKGVKEMTKEELLQRITQMFGYNMDLVKIVGGIEAVKDDKGNVTYEYAKKDGAKTRIEDLDKETLEFIFLKAQNEMTRINTEKTMRQMKEIRRIQEMNRQNRMLMKQPRSTVTYKPYKPPPTAPKTYSPPKLPRR